MRPVIPEGLAGGAGLLPQPAALRAVTAASSAKSTSASRLIRTQPSYTINVQMPGVPRPFGAWNAEPPPWHRGRVATLPDARCCVRQWLGRGSVLRSVETNDRKAEALGRDPQQNLCSTLGERSG
jgi:hypothetical protein